MRMDLEGAKEARKVIKRFHECLNSPRLIPEQCYRRNHVTYPLVQYVNQITGLFLSKNYPPIPIFLGRAHGEISKLGDDLVSEPYRRIVFSYLAHMAHFINDYCDFDPDDTLKSLIPEELLAHDRQDEPAVTLLENDFQTSTKGVRCR